MSLVLVPGASNALLLDLQMMSVRNQYHWPALAIRMSSNECFDLP